MKPALSGIAAAVVLGLGFAVTGHPLDIYEYVVVVFATSILVWTLEQYNHHRQH